MQLAERRHNRCSAKDSTFFTLCGVSRDTILSSLAYYSNKKKKKEKNI